MYAKKKLEIFGSQLHYVTTVDEWQKLSMRYHLEEWENDFHPAGCATEAFGWPDGAHHVVIYVDTRYGTSSVVNTMSHEAVHAAGLVFQRIGQDHDGLSESYAHLVGYIVEWMYRSMQKGK